MDEHEATGRPRVSEVEIITVLSRLVRDFMVEHDLTADQRASLSPALFVRWLAESNVLESSAEALCEELKVSEHTVQLLHWLLSQNLVGLVWLLSDLWPILTNTAPTPKSVASTRVTVEVLFDDARSVTIQGQAVFPEVKRQPKTLGTLLASLRVQLQQICASLFPQMAPMLAEIEKPVEELLASSESLSPDGGEPAKEVLTDTLSMIQSYKKFIDSQRTDTN